MCSLANVSMVAVICLGAVVGAGAGTRPVPPPPRAAGPRPFAALKAPPAPLSFKVVPDRGLQQLEAKTTVRVLANHPFRLEASFAGLTQPAGQAAIPAEQMTVTINGKKVTIGTARVQIAEGGPTPRDGVAVPITIEVTLKGSTFYPAGRYSGNLVLAVR